MNEHEDQKSNGGRAASAGAPDDEGRPASPPALPTERAAPRTPPHPSHHPHVHRNHLLRPSQLRSMFQFTAFLVLAVAGLYLARPILVPIVIAITLTFVLDPFIRIGNRLRIPPPVSAGAVLLVLLGAVFVSMYLLTTPVQTWIEEMPETVREVEVKLRDLAAPLERMSRATEEVERLAENQDFDGPPVVQVKQAPLSDVVLSHTQSFIVFGTMVLILLYFLLASGDLFLHKLVEVQPRLPDKKRAIEIVREVREQVSTYLLTITVINIGLGIVTGLVMWLVGMPTPFLWGAMATVLNFIPYVGALVGIVVVGLVAAVTFDTTGEILLVPAAYAMCTSLEGYFVTPMVLGGRLRLSPVMIVIGLIFWGWLWGIPGVLLSVPLMSVVKILCDHVDSLKPVGVFLGR